MKKQLLLTFLGLWLGLGFVAQAQQPGSRQLDSLSLVAIYNSTSGPGWKSQTGWLTQAPLQDWFGVEVNPSSGRVVELRLNSNILRGEMSDSVRFLGALQSIIVNNNFLRSIPATILQIDGLLAINCEQNRLTFDDLIPLNQGNIDFSYDPQLEIPPQVRISVQEGDTLQLTAPIDTIAGTAYQWFRVTTGPNLPDQPLQTAPVPNPVYTDPQIDSIEAGDYYVEITNPQMDDLTLRSFRAQVRVVPVSETPRALGQLYVTYPAAFPPGSPIRLQVDSIFLAWGAIKETCRCDDEIFIWDLPDTIRDGDYIIIGPEETEGYGRGTVPPNTDNSIVIERNYPTNLGLELPGSSQYTFDPGGFSFNTANQPVSTLVAIIDLGVDSGHVDIRQHLWQNPSPGAAGAQCAPGDVHGYNFFNDNSNAFIDLISHGTHISGLITGLLDGVPIELMSLKVGDTTSSVFDIACAMSYANQKGAKVINLSMGYQGEEAPMLRRVFGIAESKDVVVITSAGNQGDDNSQNATLHWPSNYVDSFNNVISVGSVIPDGTTLSDFSNFSNTKVTIAAPGENIKSTMAGGGYGTKSGTSISNGFVTVLAAGYRAYSPAVSADNVVNILRSDEFSVEEPGLLPVVKNGRRVKFDLVNCAESPVARPDTVIMTSGTASIEIEVLINDCYASGILPVIETQPAGGSVNVNPDGKIVYQPNGFFGTTTFSYRLTANAGGSTDFDIATVEVTVPGSACTWWQILLWILLGLLVILILAWLLRNQLP